MRKTKFVSGDVLEDKSNKNINIVILYPLFLKWRGQQRYAVRWYDTEFHTGESYECELEYK